MTTDVHGRSTILWQRLDLPGYEWCELSRCADGWSLAGVTLLLHNQLPCRLDYEIGCDTQWTTLHANIRGNIGATPTDLVVDRTIGGAWSANGVALPALDGCLDIDLGFSPSTNLLPLRRLALEVGRKSDVRAAWVRFPELAIEILEQSYTRLGPSTYRYESAGGTFVRELAVDAEGFVLDYPGLWRAAASVSHDASVT